MSEKYAYFYNGVWPIRATRGETGTFIGTETPDAATGKLKINMHWIDKVSHDASGDLTLIDKATFDTLCEKIYAQKKTNFEIGRAHDGMG